MSTTRALALVVFGVLVGALGWRAWWPSSSPALDCPPDDVRWTELGEARCGGPGGEGTAAQRLAVGARLDLNRASAEELEAIPGIGPALARALVEHRKARGPFSSWGEVDAVPGVGPVLLEKLRNVADVREGGRPVGAP